MGLKALTVKSEIGSRFCRNPLYSHGGDVQGGMVCLPKRCCDLAIVLKGAKMGNIPRGKPFHFQFHFATTLYYH
jgi:hypothetical protein